MKKINIFIASSIDEFHEERQNLENFIYRTSNDIFEEFYNVKIDPFLCENADGQMVDGRKQDEFNKKIVESDFCIFLFYKKVGKYTEEELEIAFKNFKLNQSPKIYTYFKALDKNETISDSVKNMMKKLDVEFGHYFNDFSNIDTVKLRLLTTLVIQENGCQEIEIENGKCIINGKEALDLSNVSEFANNGILKQLNDELLSIDQKYIELKPIYATGKADEVVCKKYAEIAARRQNLIEQIEELQKKIFNISLRMCNDEIHGEITQKQKEAYRLFELGDLDGANSILDFDEIINDYYRRKEIRKQEQITEARICIRESVTKIEILTAMTNYKGRFDEIEKIYDAIVPEALEYMVELEVIYNYCRLLDNQNNSPKAYEVGKSLEGLYLREPNRFEPYNFAALYNLLGIICGHLALTGEKENYYTKAIELYEKLAKDNPERYNANLAMSYNNAGVFYYNQSKAERAENYYTKAIEIKEKLAKDNQERYNASLAMSYNNAGVLYKEQGKTKQAENYYTKAIEIREQLAKDNPERYNASLAMSYNNAGVLYEEQGKTKQAENYYTKAIEIYEQLAKDNPERYNANLADIYNNAGNFYKNQGKTKQAENCYTKAIEIKEQLAKSNPERYNVNLAVCYYNYGIFTDKSEYFDKALELAKTQPDNPYCKQIISALEN